MTSLLLLYGCLYVTTTVPSCLTSELTTKYQAVISTRQPWSNARRDNSVIAYITRDKVFLAKTTSLGSCRQAYLLSCQVIVTIIGFDRIQPKSAIRSDDAENPTAEPYITVVDRMTRCGDMARVGIAGVSTDAHF